MPLRATRWGRQLKRRVAPSVDVYAGCFLQGSDSENVQLWKIQATETNWSSAPPCMSFAWASSLFRQVCPLLCLVVSYWYDSAHSPVCYAAQHIVPAISVALPICNHGAWEQIPFTSLQTDETLTLQILSSASLFPLFPLHKTQRIVLQGLPCNLIDISSLMSHPTYLLVLFCINVKQNR